VDAPAFNGNANRGIAPNKNFAIIAAADMIIHFGIARIGFRRLASIAKGRRGGTEQNRHSGKLSREVCIFDC
jgi:hypothetical protein